MFRTLSLSTPRRGFTLIELILVCMIIAIIAAMAIPSILNARIAANEASAISSLRSVATVNMQYRLRFAQYAGSLANLEVEGYIDDAVGSGAKSGYTFIYTSTGDAFTLNGNPVNPGASGYRYFFVDESGVIRFSSTGPAVVTDPAVGG